MLFSIIFFCLKIVKRFLSFVRFVYSFLLNQVFIWKYKNFFHRSLFNNTHQKYESNFIINPMMIMYETQTSVHKFNSSKVCTQLEIIILDLWLFFNGKTALNCHRQKKKLRLLPSHRIYRNETQSLLICKCRCVVVVVGCWFHTIHSTWKVRNQVLSMSKSSLRFNKVSDDGDNQSNFFSSRSQFIANLKYSSIQVSKR